LVKNKKHYTGNYYRIEECQMLKTTILTAILMVSVSLIGCTSNDKKDIKHGFTEVGHATRDATRATGHFFRDTTKDVINNVKEATNE
jgi:hypothetical protein